MGLHPQTPRGRAARASWEREEQAFVAYERWSMGVHAGDLNLALQNLAVSHAFAPPGATARSGAADLGLGRAETIAAFVAGRSSTPCGFDAFVQLWNDYVDFARHRAPRSVRVPRSRSFEIASEALAREAVSGGSRRTRRHSTAVDVPPASAVPLASPRAGAGARGTATAVAVARQVTRTRRHSDTEAAVSHSLQRADLSQMNRFAPVALDNELLLQLAAMRLGAPVRPAHDGAAPAGGRANSLEPPHTPHDRSVGRRNLTEWSHAAQPNERALPPRMVERGPTAATRDPAEIAAARVGSVGVPTVGRSARKSASGNFGAWQSRMRAAAAECGSRTQSAGSYANGTPADATLDAPAPGEGASALDRAEDALEMEGDEPTRTFRRRRLSKDVGGPGPERQPLLSIAHAPLPVAAQTIDEVDDARGEAASAAAAPLPMRRPPPPMGAPGLAGAGAGTGDKDARVGAELLSVAAARAHADRKANGGDGGDGGALLVARGTLESQASSASRSPERLITSSPSSPSRRSMSTLPVSFAREMLRADGAEAAGAERRSNGVRCFSQQVVGTFSCHGMAPVEGEAADKINQDCGCFVNPFAWPQQALFAVFDGHGPSGDVASQAAMSAVTELLADDARLQSDPRAAVIDAFEGAEEVLRRSIPREAEHSGAVAVVALLRRDVLHVAGAGDCRCVLARARADGADNFDALQLTTDHNFESAEERARVSEFGGQLSASKVPEIDGYFEPARVFRSLDNPVLGPGLAMSRSIGDLDANPVGVIATPEVREHEIDPLDRFFILASDGVWEFVSSEEAVEIVGAIFAKGWSAESACKQLIARAAVEWMKEEGDYRDDITCIVVYLSCRDEMVGEQWHEYGIIEHAAPASD